LDAIVFTSKAQVERLFKVSAELGAVRALDRGLARTFVAAIGPVVADVLASNGCKADSMPDERYFMKPLVQTLSQALGSAQSHKRCM
jgi:uroporphyrinogen-III synthase